MRSIQLFLRSRCNSFGFAFKGLVTFFRQESNASIHLVFTLIAGAGAIYFRVSAGEALVLLVVIAMVWISEIFNTAVERAMDFISKERHPDIKFIKDLAACAVLIAAITAFAAGLVIFIPKIV